MSRAEYMRKYNATEKGAAYNRAHVKAWRQANPEKRRLQAQKEAARRSAKGQAMLRAKRRQRVVKWNTEFSDFAMDEVYKLAQLRSEITQIPWEVDHIIPLLGKNVSGLHVYNNLQLLPRQQNRQKYNGY